MNRGPKKTAGRPMTATHLAMSDHIVVRCPACGGHEPAEAGTTGYGPEIVCAECGETWPSSPLRSEGRTDLVLETREHIQRNLLEAERRPLVTYTDRGAEKAWATKMAGDYWPEPPRQRRFPLFAGATAAVFFLAAFFGGREAAVSAVPDLAGLYAAIGLPVYLEGFAIEAVAAERMPTAAGDRIVVQGTLRNVGAEQGAVPKLAALLYDSARMTARAEGFDSPVQILKAGEATPFRLTLDAAPALAVRVAVRFQRPGEKLPRNEGTARPATQ
jgi:hypothetical protein